MKANVLTKETILNYGATEKNYPDFHVGDTIEVAQVVKDGEKERIQLFQGDVIAMHQNGVASTFTVRKLGANNVGVERIFPFQSRNIAEIKIVKRGRVRRAKLNYIKELTGRAARIEEKQTSKASKSEASA